jgi:hypothetical protein
MWDKNDPHIRIDIQQGKVGTSECSQHEKYPKALLHFFLDFFILFPKN